MKNALYSEEKLYIKILGYTSVRFNYEFPIKINMVRFISNTRSFSSRTVQNPKIDPWWITGFSDGEGCFLISVCKNEKYKTGWSVEPCFSIVLHKKDKAVLERIQAYWLV